VFSLENYFLRELIKNDAYDAWNEMLKRYHDETSLSNDKDTIGLYTKEAITILF